MATRLAAMTTGRVNMLRLAFGGLSLDLRISVRTCDLFAVVLVRHDCNPRSNNGGRVMVVEGHFLQVLSNIASLRACSGEQGPFCTGIMRCGFFFIVVASDAEIP